MFAASVTVTKAARGEDMGWFVREVPASSPMQRAVCVLCYYAHE